MNATSPDYTDIAATLHMMRDYVRYLEHEKYRLHELRCSAWSRIRDELAPMQKKLPKGLKHLSQGFLGAAGARYVVLSDDSNKDYNKVLRIETFHVEPVKQGRPLVISDTTNEVVGCIDREKRPLWRDERQNVPVTDQPWDLSPCFGICLPLAGPALQHGAYNALATYANRIVNSENPHITRILEADPLIQAITVDWHRTTDESVALGTAGADIPALDAQYADFVALLSGHDWSWDHADRFLADSADREKKIIARAAEMPISDALPLWHAHVPAPISSNSWEWLQRRIAQRAKVAA